MRTLDCVVIKLEGGSDWDLGVLDLPDTEEEERREEARRRREGREDRKPLHRRSHSNSAEQQPAAAAAPPPAFDDENARLMKKAKEFLSFMEPEEKVEEKKEEEEGGGKKRKHSEAEEEPEEAPPGSEQDDTVKAVQEPFAPVKDLDSVSDGEDATVTKEEEKKDTEEVEKDEKKEEKEEAMESEDQAKKAETINKLIAISKEDGENPEILAKTEGEEGEKMDSDETAPRPRALHKTSSIFLRNLAPTITKVQCSIQLGGLHKHQLYILSFETKTSPPENVWGVSV